jgi:5'-deoxynucleotidase YfbR-like HD superfamily hydrolase
VKRVKQFSQEIYALKALTRYNNKFKLINESVAEHSFFVAILILKLYEVYNFDLEKALSMGLIHDVPELHLSDITYDVKRNFPKLRDSILDAEKSIIDKRYPEWRHLFNELVVNVESVESMIVVLADVMSCIQYASTEIDLGNSGYMKNVLKESKKRMRELEKKLKKHRRK